MLTVGPQICHINNCPHGCTTRCEGHEWRLLAPEYYRKRLQELIAAAARDGVDLVAAPAAPAPSQNSRAEFEAVAHEFELELATGARARLGCIYEDPATNAAFSGWQLALASMASGWPKLDKPARVGGGTFGIGVSARLVVEAAQRQHQYAQETGRLTREEAAAAEAHRRALWDLLNGPPPAIDAPASAPPGEGKEGGIDAERHRNS